jgi:hypothetical protein
MPTFRQLNLQPLKGTLDTVATYGTLVTSPRRPGETGTYVGVGPQGVVWVAWEGDDPRLLHHRLVGLWATIPEPGRQLLKHWQPPDAPGAMPFFKTTVPTSGLATKLKKCEAELDGAHQRVTYLTARLVALTPLVVMLASFIERLRITEVGGWLSDQKRELLALWDMVDTQETTSHRNEVAERHRRCQAVAGQVPRTARGRQGCTVARSR